MANIIKMHLLQLNGECFVWINLYPTNRFEGRMKYVPFVTIFSGLFICFNLSEGIEECQDIRDQGDFSYLVLNESNPLFQNNYCIDFKFVQSGKYPILIGYMDEENRKAQFVSRFLLPYMIATALGTLVAIAIVNVIYCHFVHGMINGNVLYVPYRYE